MCRKKLTKNFIITIIELFFWQLHANFQLWSQSLFFTKTFSDFQKMDKKNVQKLKGSIGFPKNATVETIIEFYRLVTKKIIFILLR